MQVRLLEEMAPGYAGVGQTVQLMRELIDEGSKDPSVILTARRVLMAVPARDQRGEARALLEYVRERVRYTRDPIFSETMLDAPAMIERIQVDGQVAEDCDGATTLLGALLQAVGYPVDLVVESHTSDGEPSHVLLATELHGKPVNLDPTVPNLPLGIPGAKPVRSWREEDLMRVAAPVALGDDLLSDPDIGTRGYIPQPGDLFYTGADLYSGPPDEDLSYYENLPMAPPPVPDDLQVGGGSAGLPEYMTGKNEDSLWDDILSGISDVLDVANKTPWVQGYLIEASAKAQAQANALGGQAGEDLLRALYGQLGIADKVPSLPPPYTPTPVPAPAPPAPVAEEKKIPGWVWGLGIGIGVLVLGGGIALAVK